MSRCGCRTVGLPGAAAAATSCLVPSGAGTPASPFLLTPKIDPVAGNRLSCAGGGLMVTDPDNPGAWTSYVPSWTAAGGAPPVIGDGFLYGVYRRRGRSLELLVTMVFGVTTEPYDAGSSSWRWSLPAGLVAAFPAPVVAHVYNSRSGDYYPAHGLANVGDPYIELMWDHLGVTGSVAEPFDNASHVIMGALLYV